MQPRDFSLYGAVDLGARQASAQPPPDDGVGLPERRSGEGRSGVGLMTLCDTTGYPTKIAAEVKDWKPETVMERRDARRMARFSQFAIAAAMQAVAQAIELIDHDFLGRSHKSTAGNSTE